MVNAVTMVALREIFEKKNGFKTASLRLLKKCSTYFFTSIYTEHICTKSLGCYVRANSIHPDQLQQNVILDQGLHCFAIKSTTCLIFKGIDLIDFLPFF